MRKAKPRVSVKKARKKLGSPKVQSIRPPTIAELEEALYESVMLQSHYAFLLNTRDGGQRTVFKTVRQWMDRVKRVRKAHE